jgi:tRNA pseudouridine32 synthase/23S rRNA pseudouridine746 synthase
MHALGIPILNDRIYPPRHPTPDDDYNRPLQLLAKSVRFKDPLTGEQRDFKTRLSLSLLPGPGQIEAKK